METPDELSKISNGGQNENESTIWNTFNMYILPTGIGKARCQIFQKKFRKIWRTLITKLDNQPVSHYY